MFSSERLGLRHVHRCFTVQVVCREFTVGLCTLCQTTTGKVKALLKLFIDGAT